MITVIIKGDCGKGRYEFCVSQEFPAETKEYEIADFAYEVAKAMVENHPDASYDDMNYFWSTQEVK